jgi:hypothetical protein
MGRRWWRVRAVGGGNDVAMLRKKLTVARARKAVSRYRYPRKCRFPAALRPKCSLLKPYAPPRPRLSLDPSQLEQTASNCSSCLD